jgi:ribose transport system substrate-binding protein
MKTKLITLLVGLVLPLASSFAGETKGTAVADPIVIGMSVPYLPAPVFRDMAYEAEQEAKRLGVKVEVVDGNWQYTKQLSDVATFVKEHVAGILISPKTGDAFGPAIEAAVKAGIPVVTVDSKANTDKMLLHVGADNVEAGRVAARHIVERLGNHGSVIEIEGLSGTFTAMDRKTGFEEVIRNSNVKILASETAGWERSKAQSLMKTLLKKFPDFDAVFAANDEMIIGAIEAMSSAGIKPGSKVTVGTDASPDAFKYLKAGKLSATIDQFPGKQAVQALQCLVDYIKNGTMPPQQVVLITPELITKAP